MRIAQFLTPGRTLIGVPGGSKKRLFETIAEFAANLHPETDAEDIFDGLIDRERLGSTGVGEGVAIPHCRLENCSEIIGILMRLDDPIDFDSIDNLPVDLVFTLLVPAEATNDHLLALQLIAEIFSQQDRRDQLRAATSDNELYLAATENQLA